MQGVVFQVLESCYVEAFGSDAWSEVSAAAAASDSYTYDAAYPDAELGRLLGAICVAQGLGQEAALRWFGERAIPHFRAFAPDLFDRFGTCWPFLRSLNDIIHPEVRELYPGVNVPDFEYPESADGDRIIVYRSARRMCALAEGLMLGAAVHYGETLTIAQSRCMLRGDDHCRFHLRFEVSPSGSVQA